MIETIRQSVAAQIAHLQAQPEVDAFHTLWYEHAGLTWGATRWIGVPMMKSPLDLFVQQDLIVDLKPELIIETGSFQGGSALFYASICDLLGHGRVLSIDVNPVEHVTHPRVTFVTGDSVAKRTLHEVTRHQHKVKGHVLVILDSCHHAPHVRKELEAYHRYVTPGSYLIVEDTNVSGKPVANPEFAAEGGPYAAIEAWLPDHPEFTQDLLCEHYLLTMHPGGWLRRAP